MDTDSETFTPLVCSVIDNVLLKAIPAIPAVLNISETDPLLNFYANFVLCWVYIWVLEPQTS